MESEADKKAIEAGEAAEPPRTGYHIDTRYPRSPEGIVRIISLPFGIAGAVLAILGFQGGPGGIYYAASGNFLIHIMIVFIIEVFIPRISMHRLTDAILTYFHAALMLASAVVSTVFAVRDYRNNRELLVAAAVLAYVCTAFALLSGSLALCAWRKYRRDCECRGLRPLCGK